MDNKLKKSELIVLIIIMLLAAVGFVFAILNLFVFGTNENQLVMSVKVDTNRIVCIVIEIITYLAIAFYAIYGYKVPHGNLLKCLMLLFAINFSITSLLDIESDSILVAVLITLIAVSIAYIAGRLDRLKQNSFILTFVLVLLIVFSIVKVYNFANREESPESQINPAPISQEGNIAGDPNANPNMDPNNANDPNATTEPNASATPDVPQNNGDQQPGGQVDPNSQKGGQILPNVEIPEITFEQIYSNFGALIQFEAIVCAYFIRYKRHRKAGMTDVEKIVIESEQ